MKSSVEANLSPLVSVVIPTFNRAKLISEMLDSVFAQTYSRLEVIVVDDGSTDNTEEVVRSYGKPIRYFFQKNAGQGAARNFGIRMASGEFIAFLDSDDLWLPAKIEKQVKFLEENPDLNWVYSDVKSFDEFAETNAQNSRVQAVALPEGWIGPQLFLRSFIAFLTVVVRRSVFAQIGLFDESPLLRCREDWDFLLRIAARFPAGVVPEVLGQYREHSQNATRGEDLELVFRSIARVIERAVDFAPLVYGPLKKKSMAILFYRTGSAFFFRGILEKARFFLRRAVHQNPLSFPSWYLLFWSLCGPKALMGKEYLKRMSPWRRTEFVGEVRDF